MGRTPEQGFHYPKEQIVVKANADIARLWQTIYLRTDASDVGIAVVLMQDVDYIKHPCKQKTAASRGHIFYHRKGVPCAGVGGSNVSDISLWG